MNIPYDYFLILLLFKIITPTLHARNLDAYSLHLMISKDQLPFRSAGN